MPALDTNLELRAEADLSATVTTTAIQVEGGSDAEWHLAWTGQTGITPVLDATLEVSIDGGTTFVEIARRRQFVTGDDPATDETEFHTSHPVYIPKPTGITDAYAGSRPRTRVRTVLTLGGTNPVFQGFRNQLAPPDHGETLARETI